MYRPDPRQPRCRFANLTGVSLGFGKRSFASSEQNDTMENYVSRGNDGLPTTRWTAASGDSGEWWAVDLGAVYDLTGYRVVFEKAADYRYRVEVSDNGSDWTVAADRSTSSGTAQTREESLDASGRYVRITYTGLPAGAWASHYEFEVFGS